MQIGFIGLGVMGGVMAANLVRAGHSLRVCDLDPDRCRPLAALGAEVAATPGAAARDAAIVMTSLPGPAQVRAVAFGEAGLLESLRAGAVWIELSTNDLSVGRELAAAARAKDLALLDAPVSGGGEGAAAGTLTVLVGGEEAVFRRCLPVLRAIGERIEHLGPSGAGYAAKIAQVMLCYIHSLALSEAMLLGAKGGVDAAKMLEIVQHSTGASYAATHYGPPILDGDYDPSFTLGLAHKDLRLAQELATSLAASLPLCDLATETYARAYETYGPEANHLMAVKLLEDAHQTPLRRGQPPPSVNRQIGNPPTRTRGEETGP